LIGSCVRQIAEHSHYVQGVAWDPLNEYIATQSSDRSVHIYTLKTKSGDFSLDPHHKISKMEIPARRRISSSSPAPPDLAPRTSFAEPALFPAASPAPSAPGTPQSLALPMPMNPPTSHTSHSRRSSFGSSPSMRRSASPAPSLPLPAVMPNSPRPGYGIAGVSGIGLGVRTANIYASEALPSFFRRLTFSPDGSLLFTPAGQYRLPHSNSDDIINTVYIYTRAGLNKPPVAFLPGHKKPSIAVRCSPIIYQLRTSTVPTKNITMDTSAAGEEIPALPESALGHRASVSSSTMDPPPFTAMSPSPSMTAPSPKAIEIDSIPPTTTSLPPGPTSAFGLPYRVVYAVATQDAVYIYDTQQTKPLCVISNLHYATFTDLSWYVILISSITLL
jgi:chromatin assembly factor 1 subunit B